MQSATDAAIPQLIAGAKMVKMRKFENRMEYPEMIKAISSGDPRIAAIVAGAILDDTLSGVIKHNFIKLPRDIEAGLFKGNSPLSSFSSKIKVAYALGLISHKVRCDLRRLKIYTK